jgi:hypothetical protein
MTVDSSGRKLGGAGVSGSAGFVDNRSERRTIMRAELQKRRRPQRGNATADLSAAYPIARKETPRP